MPARLEKRQPQLRVVSAPAKPDVQFAVEPFYVIARELPPLFKRHWRELGRHKESVPLDPHWDMMMQLSVGGMLHVITARADDKLVGYVFLLVTPHLHYRSTKHATIDMFWLDPEYRGNWTGYKLLKRAIEHARKLGVVRLFNATNWSFKNKRGLRADHMMNRLGFKAIDVHYAMILDE